MSFFRLNGTPLSFLAAIFSAWVHIFGRCSYSIFIRLTNDGNAILREIDVAHPAAKNMIELSRTQDEECGDGTTSVIILGLPILVSAPLTASNIQSQPGRSSLNRYPNLNETFIRS